MSATTQAEETQASAAPPSEAMAWDSKARRMVTIYLPLACFLIILLFPFYWMTITAFKPNAELYDYKTRKGIMETAIAAPSPNCPAGMPRWKANVASR